MMPLPCTIMVILAKSCETGLSEHVRTVPLWLALTSSSIAVDTRSRPVDTNVTRTSPRIMEEFSELILVKTCDTPFTSQVSV